MLGACCCCWVLVPRLLRTVWCLLLSSFCSRQLLPWPLALQPQHVAQDIIIVPPLAAIFKHPSNREICWENWKFAPTFSVNPLAEKIITHCQSILTGKVVKIPVGNSKIELQAQWKRCFFARFIYQDGSVTRGEFSC